MQPLRNPVGVFGAECLANQGSRCAATLAYHITSPTGYSVAIAAVYFFALMAAWAAASRAIGTRYGLQLT